MLKEPRIGAIVFLVKDLKRTEAFYRDTLGLTTQVLAAKDSDGYTEESFMIARVGDLNLIFFQKDERPGKTPVIVFSLKEGGIDGIVHQLAAMGVQIVTPVSEAPGGWTADFLDPDGHMLSFYQGSEKPR